MKETDYSKLDDNALIVLAKKDDEYAAEMLMNRYKPLVRWLSAAYFMQGAEADDVVQEGMIGLFKAIHAYDAAKGAGFGSFASSCITNRLINAVKASATKKDQPLNDSRSLDEPVSEGSGRTLLEEVDEAGKAGSAPDPQEALLYKERIEHLTLVARERLSSLEFQVLLLLLSGCGKTEIARMLEKPAKSVANAITRIRQKLKDLE